MTRTTLLPRLGVLVAAIAASFVASYATLVQSAVYTNQLIDYPAPEPEPFVVGPGDILRSVMATRESHFAVNGGTIANLAQPLPREPIFLIGNAHAVVSGGQLQVETRFGSLGSISLLRMEDNSSLRIDGGRFEAFGSHDSILDATDHSFLEILSGDFESHGRYSHGLGFYFDATANISSGHFISHGLSPVFIGPTGRGVTINIRGGTFSTLDPTYTDLWMMAGTVNLLVAEARLGGSRLVTGPVSAERGVLSVSFPNGELEELSFRRSFGILHVIIVPEPSSIVQLALAALLSGLRRADDLTNMNNGELALPQ